MSEGTEERSAMHVAEAVEHVRPSITQISLLATDLSDIVRQVGRPLLSIPLGTAFLVNTKGYVITARHVIEHGRRCIDEIQASEKQIHVGLAQPNTENMRGNFTLVDFDVIDEDERHDLALLKLKRNPFRGEVHSGIVIQGKSVPLIFGTATLDPSRPNDAVAVAISGYPLGEPVLVTNVGWMATSWSFEIAEIPVLGAPEWFRKPDVSDTFLADVQVNRGNSGGPVYMVESGAVIGVCVSSKPAPVRDQQGNDVTIDDRRLFYDSGLTVVVPVRYVIELLRKLGLNWSEPKS